MVSSLGNAKNIVTKLKADNADFNRKMGAADSKVSQFGKTAGIAGAAVAGAGALLFKFAGDAAEAADRVDKMSQQLGLSRQSFQEWDFALSQSGVQIDKLKAAAGALNSAFNGAANGAKRQSQAFQDLGFDLSTGVVPKMDEIITRLQGVESEQDKTRIAATLLGATYSAELAPVINQTAEDFASLRQEAVDTGLILGDDAVDAGVEFADAMDKVSRQMGTAKNEIGLLLADGLVPLVDATSTIISGFNDLPDPVKRLALTGAGIGTAVGVVGAISALTGVVTGNTSAVAANTAALTGAGAAGAAGGVGAGGAAGAGAAGGAATRGGLFGGARGLLRMAGSLAALAGVYELTAGAETGGSIWQFFNPNQTISPGFSGGSRDPRDQESIVAYARALADAEANETEKSTGWTEKQIAEFREETAKNTYDAAQSLYDVADGIGGLEAIAEAQTAAVVSQIDATSEQTIIIKEAVNAASKQSHDDLMKVLTAQGLTAQAIAQGLAARQGATAFPSYGLPGGVLALPGASGTGTPLESHVAYLMDEFLAGRITNVERQAGVDAAYEQLGGFGSPGVSPITGTSQNALDAFGADLGRLTGNAERNNASTHITVQIGDETVDNIVQTSLDRLDRYGRG